MAVTTKTKTPAYDASTIQVLEGLEAVRRRPACISAAPIMRGLHHLVREIVDNSVDEALGGHCDTIVTRIGADGVVTVTDNGRGIPVDKHAKLNKSALEVIMTILHAGGKFGGGGYKVSGGLHGVGASVVNALSEWCRVEVRRDGKVYRQEYQPRRADRPGQDGRPRRARRPRHDDLVPGRHADLHRRARLQLRPARPVVPRDGLPDPGSEADADRRALRPGDDLLLRGRHRLLRAPSQPEPERRSRPAVLRAARDAGLSGRGRAAVQRLATANRPTPSPTTSTRSTAARTCPGSSRR